MSKYAPHPPVRCQFIQKGVNDTYEIESGSERLYLRVYRSGWRAKSEIEAEMAMFDLLDKHKQPVSRPVRRRDGAFLIQLRAPEGVRYAAIFTGALREEQGFTISRWRQLGPLTANLHRNLDSMPVDNRRFHIDPKHLLDEPLQVISPFFERRKS